jgi:hypothetical protein
MIYFSHFTLYKMKKNIVAACIFLLIILLITLLCSCSMRGQLEGYATIDKTIEFARGFQGIGKITSSTPLTDAAGGNSAVLFSTGASTPSNPKESDADSKFCAIIEGTALKIAKLATASVAPDLTAANTAKEKAISDKAAADAALAAIDLNSDDALSKKSAAESAIAAATKAVADAESAIAAVPSTPSKWTVVWDSSLSGYLGSSQLRLPGGNLVFGNTILSGNVIGLDAKLTKEGDLILRNASGATVWSLVAHELNTINDWMTAYFGRGSRVYRSTDYEEITRKYDNFKTYVDSLEKNTDVVSEVYKKLKNIRYKMDFELSELNGLSNSKVNVSNQTLESSMYLNLGITVLAASLFILIATR